ncbi:MAG: hypothetical protein U1E51_20290 [Candidatus Binatia bacterium]|nr:hypothetical protein [Candidatus Binatia bacterium]
MEPRSEHNRAKNSAAVKRATSLRCCCGSLLARVVEDGVELKCRRCKRHVIVPLDGRAAVRITV